MTRFDFFSKMSYIIYKNKNKIQTKKIPSITNKGVFETIFNELEKSRTFVSNPLLESLRRHKFNYKRNYVVEIDENKMEVEKQKVLENLPIFSIFKNIK